MYARVLRKWSPNAKLMSFMWLTVIISTMLLLFVCAPAPAAAVSSSASASSVLLSKLLTPATTTTTITTAAATHAKQTTANAAAYMSALNSSLNTIPVTVTVRAAGTASAAAVVAQQNVGVTEESFYIPIASEADSNSAHVANNFYTKRLINALSSSSSSSSSRSSSSSSSKYSSISSIERSKIISSSRPSSNTYDQQHAAADADDLAYAFYYQAPQVTVFQRTRQQEPQQQQLLNIDSNMQARQPKEYEGNVADELEEEEENIGGVAVVDVDEEDDVGNEEEAIENDEVPEVGLVAEQITASPELQSDDLSAASHQIAGVVSRHNNERQPHAQQHYTHWQQLAVGNSKNAKTRRHVSQHEFQPAQQQHASAAALDCQTFPNKIGCWSNKTHTVPAAGLPPASSPPQVYNATATAPSIYRYIIEAYEVPPSLPYTGELTEPQRRMLRQQHLRMLQQQQAARSRRDSRAFALRPNVANSPGGYQQQQQQQQQYYTSQQQSQPFQRLQQQKQRDNRRNSPHKFQQHQRRGQQQQQQYNQHSHHSHSHSNANSHQQRQSARKHAQRYCSARDPAQLAFEAPTVVKAKLTSMESDRHANFSVTFLVEEVYKQQFGFLQKTKYLRLQFANRNNSGDCDIYRVQLQQRGLVRNEELELMRSYLVFLQQEDLSNFTILGKPIRHTRRLEKVVREAVNESYAQPASIRSIMASNLPAESGKELRITCRVSGRPPPKVTWFKDHKSINRNRNLYQVRHFKKRSELIISSFNGSDAGHYECRAKNKATSKIERRAMMITASIVPRFETHSTGGTAKSCPNSEFCLNGGTCKFFTDMAIHSCICPEGFNGERCEHKELNDVPPSTFSNERECGDKKFRGDHIYKTGYIADDPDVYTSLPQPLPTDPQLSVS